MARSKYTEQVEETHQGDVARHNHSNALGTSSRRVVVESLGEFLTLEHLAAYCAYGTQYVAARKPTIPSDGILDNAVAPFVAAEVAKSLT
jgi:hypothetical protein